MTRQSTRLMVDHFLESHDKPPLQIILDADATDDPMHGNQEGRFFHGYYGHYCYLPLYIFCGEFLLCARLRSSDIDASAGTVEELKRIVSQIRKQWPKVKILLRGDSGFCREKSWPGAKQQRRLRDRTGQERCVDPRDRKGIWRKPKGNFRRLDTPPATSKISSTAPRRVGAGSAGSSAKRSIWQKDPIRGSW